MLEMSPPARTKISDVNELRKTSEQSESRCLLNLRLATWHQRLHACVRAGGRHFEQMM